MITTIQVVLLVFLLFAISRVILRFKDGHLGRMAFVFWLAVFVPVLVGTLLPQTTDAIADVFGVGRGVDVVIYISIAILYYLVFRTNVMMEDLRQEITNLTREIALTDSRRKT
jgi:hypothetical protein